MLPEIMRVGRTTYLFTKHFFKLCPSHTRLNLVKVRLNGSKLLREVLVSNIGRMRWHDDQT